MSYTYQKVSRLFCLLILIIIIFLIVGTKAIASEPSQWASNEIEEAIEVNAYTDALVDNYQGPLSREAFVELLVKTYEAVTDEVIDIHTVKNPFTDTSQLHVIKAYAIGIANGTTANTFSPEQLVTREQMIVMLMRMVDEVALKRDVVIFEEGTQGQAYFDDGEISSWAKTAIYKAKHNEVISGTGNNTFNPKGQSTKEQALLINYRLLTHIVDSDKVSETWKSNLASYEEDVRLVSERSLGDYASSDRKAFVTADVLNLRTTPSTDSKETIIDQLSTFEEVVIIEDVGEWYKIAASNNRFGYVHSDYIHEYDPSNDTWDIRMQIVAYAKQFQGTPYRYAGNSLSSGIDCSAFTKQVFRPYGYVLSRSSSAQGSNGYSIKESDLQPGDLVFYGYSGNVSHVALYVGDDKIIHATISRGVLVTDMRGYLNKPLISFRRVIY